MTTAVRTRAGSSPDPSELLSIIDRARHLWRLRMAVGAVVIAASVVWQSISTVPSAWIVLSTVAYVGLSSMFIAIVRRGRRIALPALQGGLLLDGIYLASMIAVTGGGSSPLRLLLGVHVVGVTLTCSYRTGLKLALWNTLLFLLAEQAVQGELLPGAPTFNPAGAGADAALTIVGLWLLALGTAAFSAASERELRRQKADLKDLSAMVARIDCVETSGDIRGIPGILLDQLCETFGFVRGVVLASPEGELELIATTDEGEPAPIPEGMDPVMSRAWSEKACQLVRELDLASDPRLASLLPGSRNVVVVPLFLVGGHRLGIVAVERGNAGPPMHRWELEMIGQFTAHAALALYNGWLTEQRERTRDDPEPREAPSRSQRRARGPVEERTDELRQVIIDLREVDQQRRRLLHHVVRAAEDERLRIAHDVHDDPVQKLAAVKMRLEMLAAANPHLPEITEAHKTVASTIKSMRRMLFDLSPPILDEEGIGAALRVLPRELADLLSLVSGGRAREQPPRRPVSSSTARPRKRSPTLANTRICTTRVGCEQRDDGVLMEIEDDGVGFEPQRPRPRPVISASPRYESAQRWREARASCGACPAPVPACRCGSPVTPESSRSSESGR